MKTALRHTIVLVIVFLGALSVVAAREAKLIAAGARVLSVVAVAGGIRYPADAAAIGHRDRHGVSAGRDQVAERRCLRNLHHLPQQRGASASTKPRNRTAPSCRGSREPGNDSLSSRDGIVEFFQARERLTNANG